MKEVKIFGFTICWVVLFAVIPGLFPLIGIMLMFSAMQILKKDLQSKVWQIRRNASINSILMMVTGVVLTFLSAICPNALWTYNITSPETARLAMFSTAVHIIAILSVPGLLWAYTTGKQSVLRKKQTINRPHRQKIYDEPKSSASISLELAV